MSGAAPGEGYGALEPGRQFAAADPAATTPLGDMVLPDLLKLSGRLRNTRRYGLGALVVSVGGAVISGGVGAVLAGEPAKGAVLVAMIAGAVAVAVGALVSADRSESIDAIRRDLDFDIDNWCREDQRLAGLRDRYAKMTRLPSAWERIRRKRG